MTFKYNEDLILEEIKKYLQGTYNAHYVGKDNVQSLDVIFSSGHGEGFCTGSIIKYAARFGKKNGRNRKDLLKIVHYAILMLYLQSFDEEKKEPQLELLLENE